MTPMLFNAVSENRARRGRARHTVVIAFVGSQFPLGGALYPEVSFQNAFLCKLVPHNQMVKEFRGRTLLNLPRYFQ